MNKEVKQRAFRWSQADKREIAKQVLQMRKLDRDELNFTSELKRAQQVLAPERQRTSFDYRIRTEMEREVGLLIAKESVAEAQSMTRAMDEERLAKRIVELLLVALPVLQAKDEPAYGPTHENLSTLTPRVRAAEQPEVAEKTKIGLVGYHAHEVQAIERTNDAKAWNLRIISAHPDSQTGASKWIDKFRGCAIVIVRTRFLSHAHAHSLKISFSDKCRWLDNGGSERAQAVIEQWIGLRG